MSTTLTDKIVITRKPHVCFSCLRKFPEGTEMRYWTGMTSDGFNSVYCCETCDKIMDKYPWDDDGDGYPEGFVREMLEKDQTPEQLLESLCHKKQKI